MLNPNYITVQKSIKGLFEHIVLDKKPLLELSSGHIKLLKNGLTSTNSKKRKTAALLILYISYQDHSFSEILRQRKLLLKIDDYTGIALNYSMELESTKEFLNFLKKDPQFVKKEVKSNRLYIKHFLKDISKQRTKITFSSMTELKYHFEEKKFEFLPDPLASIMWYYKKQEKFRVSNLECSEEIEKLKLRKLRRERRKLKEKRRRRQKELKMDQNPKRSISLFTRKNGRKESINNGKEFKISRRKFRRKSKGKRFMTENVSKSLVQRRRIRISLSKSKRKTTQNGSSLQRNNFFSKKKEISSPMSVIPNSLAGSPLKPLFYGKKNTDTDGFQKHKRIGNFNFHNKDLSPAQKPFFLKKGRRKRRKSRIT